MIDSESSRTQAYNLARERYGEIGVDTEQGLERLSNISVSIQCWQGDDVGGFEVDRQSLSGGIAVTGCYPGKARNADELRADLDRALSLIPGKHRVNLHASYAETSGRFIDRNEVRPDHFSRWIDWARESGLGIDFNPTFFLIPRLPTDILSPMPIPESAGSGSNTAWPPARSAR